jgi:hypothetical protein
MVHTTKYDMLRDVVVDIDSEDIQELENVGRFYAVTSPEQNQKASKKLLFLLGQKHSPEIVERKLTSTRHTAGLPRFRAK